MPRIVFARPPKRIKRKKPKAPGPALASAIAKPKRRTAPEVEVTEEIWDWFKANIRPRGE